jgi:HAMP domain-containing protein
MLDVLEPWMVRSAVVISALFLFDAALYGLNVWLERRQWPIEASSHNRKHGRSAAA